MVSRRPKGLRSRDPRLEEGVKAYCPRRMDGAWANQEGAICSEWSVRGSGRRTMRSCCISKRRRRLARTIPRLPQLPAATDKIRLIREGADSVGMILTTLNPPCHVTPRRQASRPCFAKTPGCRLVVFATGLCMASLSARRRILHDRRSLTRPFTSFAPSLPPPKVLPPGELCHCAKCVVLCRNIHLPSHPLKPTYIATRLA